MNCQAIGSNFQCHRASSSSKWTCAQGRSISKYLETASRWFIYFRSTFDQVRAVKPHIHRRRFLHLWLAGRSIVLLSRQTQNVSAMTEQQTIVARQYLTRIHKMNLIRWTFWIFKTTTVRRFYQPHQTEIALVKLTAHYSAQNVPMDQVRPAVLNCQ